MRAFFRRQYAQLRQLRFGRRELEREQAGQRLDEHWLRFLPKNPESRLFLGGFRFYDPTTYDPADFHCLRRQFRKAIVGQTLCLVRDPQIDLQNLEQNINFIQN